MRSCPQKAGFAPLRGGVIFLPQKDRFCRGPPKLATFLDFNESLWKNHSNFRFKHIWQAGSPSETAIVDGIFEIPTLQSYKISQGRESLL